MDLCTLNDLLNEGYKNIVPKENWSKLPIAIGIVNMKTHNVDFFVSGFKSFQVMGSHEDLMDSSYYNNNYDIIAKWRYRPDIQTLFFENKYKDSDLYKLAIEEELAKIDPSWKVKNIRFFWSNFKKGDVDDASMNVAHGGSLDNLKQLNKSGSLKDVNYFRAKSLFDS